MKEANQRNTNMCISVKDSDTTGGGAERTTGSSTDKTKGNLSAVVKVQ